MTVEFRIADTFTAALARLGTQEQKIAKTTAFDLQIDPVSSGLQFHRIDRSRDPNFWSVRASRDLRLIVHKTSASFLLAYVGHHDDAYNWAERRRIEAHPRTGAAQIVEIRERVEQAVLRPAATKTTALQLKTRLAFAGLSADDLLLIGVPADWVADVLAATEDSFLLLADHLPSEAAESLLEYATSGRLSKPAPPIALVDAFAHPDAQRRFRAVENQDELARALDAPWNAGSSSCIRRSKASSTAA